MGMYFFGQLALVEIILGVIAAIVLTILTCIFILPEKKRAQLGEKMKWIHDQIQFKVLWVEKILKVLYIFTTLLITCVGIFLLFGPTFLIGIILIIVGIVVVRVCYELTMIQILILKNAQQINNKMGSGSSYSVKETFEQTPAAFEPAPEEEPEEEPEVEPEPLYRFCAQCGTRYDANKGGCPNGCK